MNIMRNLTIIQYKGEPELKYTQNAKKESTLD